MTKKQNETKLIFIYGPPASGKLSIAKKLSDITGISLFHNHLTFDLASSIYEIWSKKFYDYCEELRLDGIKRALHENRTLIFTFCFSYPEDLAFIKKIKKVVKNSGSSLFFIQLKASQNTLDKRVVSEDRSKYLKINKLEDLEKFEKNHNCSEEIPKVKSLKINTDKKTIKQSVKSIIKYYKLKKLAISSNK